MKNVTLMSISAIAEYVRELETEQAQVDDQIASMAKIVATAETSLKDAHEHIKMLEKELRVGAKKVPVE
jgi:archaellum component FlaC